MIDPTTFAWPQWLWLGLAALGLVGAVGKHGQEEIQKVDYRKSLIATLLLTLLLAKGGFFA